jgi:hypothetical protein
MRFINGILNTRLVCLLIVAMALFGTLLMGQDCLAQTGICDPDPCQGIPNAVVGTCTEIGGPCTGPSDYICSCDLGYTWQRGTHACGEVGDSSLIGIWELSTVNGQNPVAGVWLRWEITATTIKATCDLDCVEVIRYDASNGQLVGTEMVSQTGTQCGEWLDDDPVLGTYTVTQNTLTVVAEDPELIPPTATFVFVRVG